MDSMVGMDYDLMLPPHWRKKDDGRGYINEITFQESDVNPFIVFMEKRAAEENAKARAEYELDKNNNNFDFYKDYSNNSNGDNISRHDRPEYSERSGGDQSPKIINPFDKSFATDGKPQSRGLSRGVGVAAYHDYRSKWMEQDNQGNAETYGLCIRFHPPSRTDRRSGGAGENRGNTLKNNDAAIEGNIRVVGNNIYNNDSNNSITTGAGVSCNIEKRKLHVDASGAGGRFMMKFDGVAGEWMEVPPLGNYGPPSLHDLFIGAKINVYGRHLTVSSMNAAATKWVEKEGKLLLSQQARFQGKIESIGKIPVVRRKLPKAGSGRIGHFGDGETLRHITRDAKPPGHVNLRQLVNENARLGEQLADLGLACFL